MLAGNSALSVSCTPIKKTVLLTFGYVQIEKVTIQNCLHDTSNYSDEIVMTFHVIPVNPIQDIESSISSQREEIMRRNTLRFSGSRYHKQLRKNSNGF